MPAYHAVMLDETGCEFGAGVTATDRETAYEYLRENYPESRIVQLESPQDTRERERRLYEQAARDYDFGPDYGYEYDEF